MKNQVLIRSGHLENKITWFDQQVGKFIQLMSTFFGGFAVAFIRGWLLALVLLSCVPLIVVAGGIMALVMSKMSSLSQAAYAEAGNVVEQTVGAIRTVRFNKSRRL